MSTENELSRWVSATIGKDRYKTEMLTDAHEFIADEPSVVGGTDLGPSPGDFIRASLASCTAITLRMYADRKQLNVDQVRVKVSTHMEGNKTVFTSTIEIIGDLTEAQEKRMLQIADLCPVHKMLTRPLEIRSAMTVTKV